MNFYKKQKQQQQQLQLRKKVSFKNKLQQKQENKSDIHTDKHTRHSIFNVKEINIKKNIHTRIDRK